MCFPEIQDSEIYVCLFVCISSKRTVEVLDKIVKQEGNWNHSHHSCLIVHFSVSIYLKPCHKTPLSFVCTQLLSI